MKKDLLTKKIISAYMASSLIMGYPFYAKAANEVTVGTGTASSTVTAVNNGIINTNGITSNGDSTFKYKKEDFPGGLENLNLCFYGMASLVTDSTNTSRMVPGDYVTLTNNGTINMHFKDIVENNKNVLDTASDSSKTYDNIMGWGMIAGNNSTLINNGSINMYFDENSSYDEYGIFSHPMYVYDNSTMINNGTIKVLGNGSNGANVRGMTSSHSGLTITNNGLLYIDVDKSYMSRGLATTKGGSVLTNNGTIYNRSGGATYGMAENGGCTVINNGALTVISYGLSATKQIGVLTPLTADAYGIGENSSVPSDAYYYNYGIINAAIQSTAGTDAYSAANGMCFVGVKPTTAKRYVNNTGIINVSSDVTANGSNNNQTLSAELGVNTMYSMRTSDCNVNVSIGKWATTLRDFATTKDLFAARKATLDFSNAELILRPAQGYTAGTAYSVSQAALINNIEFSDAANALTIKNFDKIQYSTELPEFLTVSVSNEKAAINTVNNVAADQKMVAAAAMNQIDFVRSGMNEVERVLDKNNRAQDEQQWFFMPYGGHLWRDNGMSSLVHGFIGGADWKLGAKISGGVHAVYAKGNADGGIYNGNGYIHSGMGGLHFSYSPQDQEYVEGQFTYFSNSGANNYSVNYTGTTLQGKSSNDADGVYASLMLGNKVSINKTDNLQSSFGLSTLHFQGTPNANWTAMGTALNGYTMEMGGVYNATYASAMAKWTHGISSHSGAGKLIVGLGIKYKLAADDLSMRMINTSMPGSVSEDDVLGVTEAAYCWNGKNHDTFKIGYNGTIGKNIKENIFSASFARKF
ncbi:MAG: autotransporter domain-containing protein [Pelosinus sp.]|nr:autotransporter domain-containing protein [Pelosinus sp.]